MAFEWLKDIENIARRVPGTGQIIDIVDPNDAGEDEARQLAALYDNLKYTDPKSDPDYAAALKRLLEYSKGGLTPEDRAREYEALGEAEKFAAGESGAIAQDAAARGGGGAGVNSIRQQLSAQGAAKRLGSADVAMAGEASKRALAAQAEFTRQMQINTDMQNRFAEWKTGGQAAGIKNLQDIKEHESAAQNANRDALTNEIASLALGMPVKGPPTASAAGMPSTAGGSSYWSSGNVGIPMPGRSSSTIADATPTSTAPAPMTAAEAASKAYTDALPFAQMAPPGSAPSTTSHSPFEIPDNPTLPRKVVMPVGY